MEGDSKENIVSSPFRKFQSTPSAWRETLLLPFFLFSRSHFNPLPPHGGRPFVKSTNALAKFYFNPLPPHGGRPRPSISYKQYCFISIHSLRMEGDVLSQSWFASLPNFNPLPPHGGRPDVAFTSLLLPLISIHSLRMEGDPGTPCKVVSSFAFQSTPSAWRETDQRAEVRA